jgi:hypothetical protein
MIFMIFSVLPAFAVKRTEIVQNLFRSVENWMGTPYLYGSQNKEGTDCSGFTSNVYLEVFNIKLPRSVSEQKLMGELVTGSLQPGDLVFFNIDGSISHVGIYVFDNKFIHAASEGPETGVIKSSLDESYYKTRFAYAKRIITLPENDNDEIIQKEIPSADYKLDIIFGKTLYRGKIIDVTSVFSSDETVFFKVMSMNNNPADFKVEFENQDTNIIEKSVDIQIEKNEVNKKIELVKGNYKVKILKNNCQILEKEIKIN